MKKMDTRTAAQKLRDARDRKVKTEYMRLVKQHPELAQSRVEELVGSKMAQLGSQPVTRKGVHEALVRQGVLNQR